MPLYEYQCNMCGAHFERRQAFGDASVPAFFFFDKWFNVIFTAPGIVFKGSGWYVTDSRKSSPSTSAD